MKSQGEIIIDAVVRAAAIKRVIVGIDGTTTFVWEANSPEQIEAAIREAGYVPGRLRGFLPQIPDLTLFLIDVCDDKPHRGTLMGALIPDCEDGRSFNARGLIASLKMRAEGYIRDFDEARKAQEVKP